MSIAPIATSISCWKRPRTDPLARAYRGAPLARAYHGAPLARGAPGAYIAGMTSLDPRSLLYRPGQLSPDEARALTRRTLAKCDDGELFLQFVASESFAFDDGRLKTADYSRNAGFGLRGVSGEMTGFAHANELSTAAIARAGETLSLLDDYLRQGNHHDSPGNFLKWLYAHRPVHAWRCDAEIFDIGNRDDYARAQVEFDAAKQAAFGIKPW